jgi:hypothetical protein
MGIRRRMLTMLIARRSAVLAAFFFLMIWSASLVPLQLSAGHEQDDAFTRLSAELAKAKNEYDVVGIPQAVARLKKIIPMIAQLPAEQRKVLEAEAFCYYGAGLAAMNKTADAEEAFLKMLSADETYQPANMGPKINPVIDGARAKWREKTGRTLPVPPKTEATETPGTPNERIKAAIDAIWTKIKAGGPEEGAQTELENLHTETLVLADEPKKSELQAKIYDLRGEICMRTSDFDGAVQYYRKMVLTDRGFSRSTIEYRHDARRDVLVDYAENGFGGRETAYSVVLAPVPSQAEVSIDSGPFQPNPGSIQLKKPFFTVRLRAKGYKPMTRTELILSQGQVISLKLEEDGLEYRFETIPPGATVAIGDSRLDKTTPCSSLLQFGKHLVRLELEGYAAWTDTLELEPGQDPGTISRRLIPAKYGLSSQLEPEKKKNVKYPISLTYTKKGFLYVLDIGGQNYIRRFKFDSGFQSKVGENASAFQKLKQPVDIAVDSKDNIYLCDRAQAAVFRFDSLAQSLVDRFVGSGSGDAKLNNPNGIAFDSQDNLYVADSASDNEGRAYGRLVVFGPDRKLRAVWGMPRPGEALLKELKDVTVNSKDEILAVTNDSVIVWSKDGAILRSWGGTESDARGFSGLLKISVDDRDCIYVVERGNKRVLKFDENGRFISIVCDPQSSILKAPMALAVGARGRIYVVDSELKAILIFTGPDSEE